LQHPDLFQSLSRHCERLVEGLCDIADEAGVPFYAHSIGSMFGLFFTDASSIHSFDDVAGCDSEKFKRFFHAMLDEGVMLAPSPFEAGFVSAAHSEKVIDETLVAKVAMGKV